MPKHERVRVCLCACVRVRAYVRAYGEAHTDIVLYSFIYGLNIKHCADGRLAVATEIARKRQRPNRGYVYSFSSS